MNHDHRFSKTQRLLNAQDYSRVFEKADARASHRHMLLLARRSEGSQSRLGLVIAKKHIKLAVQRNRIKRLAREFFRNLHPTDYPIDVILLARKGLGDLDNGTVSSILLQQWRRLDRHIKPSTTTETQD